MSWSRWKMMASVLSVSLGGLATVAGQCPKPDANKGSKNPAEMPISADNQVAQAAPPAGPIPKVPPMPPSLPSVDALPGSPALPPPGLPTPLPTPPGLPPAVNVELPGSGLPQPLPLPTAQMPETHSKKHEGAVNPPPMTPMLPPGGPTSPTPPPALGGVEPQMPGTSLAPTPPSLPLPAVNVGKPGPNALPNTPPLPEAGFGSPQSGPALSGSYVPGTPSEATTAVKPAPTVVPASSVSNAVSKFRIVLRVGEGEPTFEVRSGDDLVLKVVCDKVDIKSPEKGSGPSTVKAAGKVHFVGFGAEGTCDELAFLAGTGEVSMTGNVKIHVKDKLGRVESELSTETVKYKIDSSAISGSLKP